MKRYGAGYVKQILGHLETGSLDGTEEPLRIYLTCYHTLQANNDTWAQEILHTAHQLLQEWTANNIDDESLRHSLLNNVQHNRVLIEACANLPDK